MSPQPGIRLRRWLHVWVAVLALPLGLELGLRALALDPYPHRGGGTLAGEAAEPAESSSWVPVGQRPSFPPKRPGELRVALVAGGATSPEGIPADATVAAALEAELRRRAPGRDLRVIDLSTYAFHLGEMARAMEPHLDRARPDLLVAVVGTDSLPILLPGPILPFLEPAQPWTALGRTSYLFGHIERLLYAWTARGWLLDHYRRGSGRPDSAAMEDLGGGARRLRDAAGARSIGFMVALVPPPLASGDDPLSEGRAEASALLNRLGVTVLDLWPGLRDADPRDLRRWSKGPQYGALGQRRLAALLAGPALQHLGVGGGGRRAAQGAPPPRRLRAAAVSGGPFALRVVFGLLGLALVLLSVALGFRWPRRPSASPEVRPLGARLRRGLTGALVALLALVAGLGTVEITLRLIDFPPPKPLEMPQGLPPAVHSTRAEIGRIGPRRPGEIRIAVLGDSMTFGQGVPEEQAFPAVLEARLRAADPGQPIRVFNLGRPGDDIEAEAERYPPWQEALRPQHLLVVTYMNDLASADTQMALDLIYGLGGEPGWPARTFWTLGHLRARLQRAVMQRVTVSYYQSRFALGRELREESRPQEDALRLLKARCDRDGTKMHLVVFPWLYGLDDYPLMGLHALFREQGERVGVPVFDLLPAFRGRDACGLRLTPLDEHPNVEGHRIAGEALARYLLPRL